MIKDYPVISQTLLDETQKSAERFWSDAGVGFLTQGRNLNSSSVVLDVGGYLGDWTASVTQQYDCYVHVFEPVPQYAVHMKLRFIDNPKIKVYNFGLDDCDYSGYIALMAESSTMFMPVDVYQGCPDPRVQIRGASAVLSELQIDQIDFMTLNGEGCEYGILKNLIESGRIESIKTIQVQFHNFYPDAENRRNQIREQLKRTHHETFCYPFVWEEWSQ